MAPLTRIVAALAAAMVASAHTVITYPGWRGNNLHTNGTAPSQNPDSVGVDHLENGTLAFPWGQQWMYPCGGMPQSTNRTKWPVHGGAVSIQPGWFPGHSQAFFYVNIGIQEEGQLAPPNMSHPVVPPFQITGPSNQEYGGQFCLPQVGMPANLSLEIGTNITLQVIETAQHGAALYSCVDLVLADPSEVEPVTKENCINTTNIGFNLVFTSTALASGAQPTLANPASAIALFAVVMLSIAWSMW